MKVNWREPGLPASVVLHGALLVAALVSFASPKPFADAQEAIAVEVVDESAIRQIMRGDRQARPQPTPTPRVDRVADAKEQNPTGQAPRQVDSLQAPARQDATAPEERKEQAAAVVPPPPMPRIVPAAPPPPRPVEPPRAATPPKPAPAEKTEEQEEAEEAIRQAQRKRDEQRKAEEQRRADEVRRTEERRKADEQKRAEDKRAEDAQARADQQKREREQLEARLREDQKKAADAKAAEDRKKAEDAKKALEAAKKAADERRRREAEQEARNQATSDAARRALLASREAPQNSGNTGQEVSRTPSQGTPTATGQRLNPSDRAALIGMLADQIRACWNVPVSGRPSVLPQVRMVLNQDGSLAASPVLVNSSGDPTFRAVADSGMRAIRQCSPFRIPARFQPTFNDWRSTIVQLNPDD